MEMKIKERTQDASHLHLDLTRIWKKKKMAKNSKKLSFFAIFCHFFFFKFKILWYRTKWSDKHKIHRKCTLGSKLKIWRRNCHKKQDLLIFDDLAKFLIFCQIWSFSRIICGFFKLWETDNLKKNRTWFHSKFIFCAPYFSHFRGYNKKKNVFQYFSPV